jgi:hypothetical protein
MKQKPLTSGQLRRFAWILAALIALFGAVILPWRWGLDSRIASVVIAAILVVWSLVAPMTMAPLYRGWDRLGHALGWVNSRIILGILFFLVVTPTALSLKLLGKDPMHRRREARLVSYRVDRNASPQKADLERPF